ncbi:MAG: hypothetical protein K2H50_01770 [Paramuribaculum sp.]|nr:hypothetical protein [Paramuribaculum sp.]
MNRFFKHILGLAAVAVSAVSCSNDTLAPEVPEAVSSITITAQAVDMLPQIVSSRAGSEPKKAEEKKINRLHLFFFDKDGNFLTPDPQCEEPFGAYHIVDLASSGATAVVVPKNAFVNQQNLEGVHIVAIANPICNSAECDHTDCSFRVEGLNPDGHICHGDKADPAAEKTITCLDDLLGWYYRPAPREDITALPDGGMPMFAHFTAPAGDSKILSHEGQIQLNMRALMARVDVVVKLSPEETSEDHLFPTLKVTEYGVKNMPDCVPFTEIAEGAASEVSPAEIIKEKTVMVDDRDIIEGQESAIFTYYTYENVRLRTRDPQEIYPEAVKSMGEDVRQRWKPLVADGNASAFVMKGEYVDHQGFNYKAEFTVYLGSDVIDNFEVRRNHCYKNNIYIRGLNNISPNDSYVTFDARVNVETYNEMYISVLNERHLDAHWCVLPMDVYFLGGASGECTVTIPEQDRDWIHLDHCSSEGMTDEQFVAGWGCKDYFTENMWELVPNTAATVTRSRDRIYFYVDENASTKPRMSRVEIHYKSATEERTDYIEIEQAGLLPFTYNGTTYYMEAYEEYAMHYDPLDPHGESGNYSPDGIPWAAESSDFSSKELGSTNWAQTTMTPFETNTSGDGLRLTNLILGLGSDGKISSIPLSDSKIYNNAWVSAFHYSAAKNKRNGDGNISGCKWFLPGIGQIEAVLTTIQGRVVDEFYWSSTPAKRQGTWPAAVLHPDEGTRARAAKIDANGTLVSSSSYNNTDNYPDGGRTLRTQKLRVRAIRTADGVSN